MQSAGYFNTLLFGVYPYVCLVVLLVGSLIRFDREPYTWKSDSSQLLRSGQLRLGSNLFHYGVILVILGLTITISLAATKPVPAQPPPPPLPPGKD